MLSSGMLLAQSTAVGNYILNIILNSRGFCRSLAWKTLQEACCILSMWSDLFLEGKLQNDLGLFVKLGLQIITDEKLRENLHSEHKTGVHNLCLT